MDLFPVCSPSSLYFCFSNHIFQTSTIMLKSPLTSYNICIIMKEVAKRVLPMLSLPSLCQPRYQGTIQIYNTYSHLDPTPSSSFLKPLCVSYLPVHRKALVLNDTMCLLSPIISVAQAWLHATSSRSSRSSRTWALHVLRSCCMSSMAHLQLPALFIHTIVLCFAQSLQ